MAMLVIASAWFSFDLWQFSRTPLTLKQPQSFVLKPGASLNSVAAQLAAQGVLQQPRYLVWLGRLHGLDTKIQAGEYVLSPELSPSQLLDDLSQGRVIQHHFTIVEGWTFKQLLKQLAQLTELEHSLAGLSYAEQLAALELEGEHPEGWFLPDTYNFTAGTRDVDFLLRARRAMQAELEEQWPRRAEGLPLSTPYEALILASIVEKETGLAAERPLIAGVFVARLKKGMRLQTDPTVIYGLGDAFQGDLRYRHLRDDTPYNTYTRGGLPPTPIALPSRAALQAAMQPELTEALFFVARGDGSHQFSNTLEQHNAAVIKYQLDGDASRLRTKQ